MSACTCYPNPADHEDDCPARLGEPERIEYACRYTGWGTDPATGKETPAMFCESAGEGDAALRQARAVVVSLRQWQAAQGIPVDAVVVSRPVHSWTVVDSPARP